MKFLMSTLFCISMLCLLLIYLRSPHQRFHSQWDVERLPHGVFSMPELPPGPVRIGILGENSTAGDREGVSFNKEVVERLLAVLKKKDVQAIFGTGNIVSGYGEESIFAQRLKEFSQLYVKQLGQVPFFPAMGIYELVSSQAGKDFRSTFQLQNVLVLEGSAIAYTVAIGPAFFVVLPSDRYDAEKNAVMPTFNLDMMEWLDRVLQQAEKKYPYRFAIGHEPAFPIAGVTFGHFSIHPEHRDEFWKILVKNRVLAYFAADDRHFDRSNRYGVWQIISGGNSREEEENRSTLSFYHCLLLIVPDNVSQPPQIEVLDELGNVQDNVELTPNTSPLFEFHIS